MAALLTSASSCSCRPRSRSARASIDARSAMSTTSARVFGGAPFGSRTPDSTCQPSAASTRATSRPMPRLAPVISAIPITTCISLVSWPMALFGLFGGKPSKDEFAALFAKRLKAEGLTQPFRYVAETFSLQSEDSLMFNLGNAYAYYCDAPKDQRERVLAEFVASLRD